jgi:holo-[acyl-carrier protein] synthase
VDVNMSIRVGTDIVVVSRVKESIDKFGDKFLERFLDEEEIKLTSKYESIAGFWAAKEAISKALGCGIGKELNFKDIKIRKNDKNMPYFEVFEKKFDIITSSLSISHDGGFAIAVVVIDINL